MPSKNASPRATEKKPKMKDAPKPKDLPTTRSALASAGLGGTSSSQKKKLKGVLVSGLPTQKKARKGY